ncbi:MAG: hypothetical protein HQ583_00965 [Candidatus Abyssubacteria bacterium]|nr:hypothetical protein [Candidatus Abyssubacteria bacterium]
MSRFFIQRFNRKFDKKITAIAPVALSMLLEHPWPGNVRELENIIEHAVIMADDDVIRASNLPDYLQSMKRPMLALPTGADEVVVEAVHDAETAEPEFVALADMEKQLIGETLIKCNGNQTLAAKKLGISRSTLWRKMKEYEIRASFASEEAPAG